MILLRCKILFLGLGLLFISSCGKSQEGVIVQIYSCESSSLYSISGNELLYQNKFLNQAEIGKHDTTFILHEQEMKVLQMGIKKYLESSTDEVLLNACVNDGFNHKIVFLNDKGDKVKKVFVGNYFDQRFNEITAILNIYLKRIDSEFTLGVSHFDDRDIIEQMIESQKKCEDASPSYKERMLNEWCEF